MVHGMSGLEAIFLERQFYSSGVFLDEPFFISGKKNEQKMKTHPPGVSSNDLICNERPPPPLLLSLRHGQWELSAKHSGPAKKTDTNADKDTVNVYLQM